MDVTFEHTDSASVGPVADEICEVYADAYGVDGADRKLVAFRSRLERAVDRPRFDLVLARRGAGQLIGFAFGYSLGAGDTRWWADLRPERGDDFTREDGERTFVLAEIEVRREAQGAGVGRLLHDHLLGRRLEERATLATGPNAQRAQAIYQQWGWEKVGEVPGTSGDYFDAYDLFVRALRDHVDRR